MGTATCPTAKITGLSTPAAACNCGTEALVPVTTADWCTVGAGDTGTKRAKVKCTPSTAAGAGYAAPTGGCLCGSDNVAVAAGKFCGIKAAGTGLEMPTITCPTAKTDGLSSPAAACNCGTEALVPVTTSEWCTVGGWLTTDTGTKRAKVKCTPSTAAGAGAAAPTGGCLCGSDNVAVAAGKFCGIKAAGTGLEMPTITCAAADTTGKATH